MKTLLKSLSFCLILLANFACDFNDSPEMKQARVNFYLVDAPADYDEIWIEVLALRVKSEHPNSDMTEDEDTWNEIIFEGSRSINLLDLTGGNSLLLGTDDFPAGEIDQIRLLLGENNYLMKNGQRFELKTPSAQQSGLKIKVDQPVEAGQEYNLVIDFDAAKSIVEAGNSSNIILKPVLRAFLEQSQGVKGQILPLDAEPVQVTLKGNGIEVSTFTNQTGNYVINGVAPGTYSLTFTPDNSYNSASLGDIVIKDEEVTTAATLTLTLK